MRNLFLFAFQNSLHLIFTHQNYYPEVQCTRWTNEFLSTKTTHFQEFFLKQKVSSRKTYFYSVSKYIQAIFIRECKHPNTATASCQSTFAEMQNSCRQKKKHTASRVVIKRRCSIAASMLFFFCFVYTNVTSSNSTFQNRTIAVVFFVHFRLIQKV